MSTLIKATSRTSLPFKGSSLSRGIMSSRTPTPASILDALKASLSSGPKKHEDEFYNPRPQTYWYYNGSSWISSSSSSSSILPAPAASPLSPKALRLMSWNIDILVDFAEERMSAALSYLSDLVSSTPASIPVLIYLQEMGTSDLRQIREAPWVQQRFYITDFDQTNWLFDLCGTTMLIDRRLKVSNVFRVPWYSALDRDGLFVDIPLSSNSSAEAKVLRLCNTHLESLVADPPIRPVQMESAGKYLREPQVAAALLAGDLNAIQPFDRTLHSENGLLDAYLELGGKEDSDDGYTWGYQVPQALRDRFGCSRMDKIFFRGGLRAEKFERIGMGVKAAEEHRISMRDTGQEEYVTDHYGVMGDFTFVDDWRLVIDGDDSGAAGSKLA
ncbi:hypothetical protein BU26DRAFT_290322 [Trematosphaeria pertusa]|uniref:Endonuclease/exonuclease/phosphatase domain-containing protein n=1 Tax=Trematosphaeria pertusa TaxID=390896 RepID=A0A6A6IIF0_9PLEO|nr:uncharacterized protein BU26DRAFT_290322 [Trematosphaeria pertusa]KAF2249818.1 hypothetical protein BU26DRAFT_290322 [Trematosphaeria pertusa]